jgi:hypothetical protein
MKNKVINLFGGKNTVQNQGVKYSTLLEQFLTPFVKDFEDSEYYEDMFDFAIRAWNFGNIKILLPEGESDAAINAIKEKNVDFVLLSRMIDYKVAKFKEHANFIVDYELQETSGDPILSVVTQEKEAYIAAMLEDIENQDSEDDFDENYINRSAIIVKPLQPFVDWISNLYPENADEKFEVNTYLISEDVEDVETWLKKKYDKLFMLELEAWSTNKKEWPQKRNFKMFKQWFQINLSTMVYDLEKEPVYKS